MSDDAMITVAFILSGLSLAMNGYVFYWQHKLARWRRERIEREVTP